MTSQISTAAKSVTGAEMDAPQGDSAPISVFLVDDVAELRELIRYGIEEDPDFQVVGEAGDGRAAIDGIAQTRPAAVLLDLSMPDMDGLEAIPEIRQGVPNVAIIVLSGFSADRMGRPARERGADGYVEKGTPMDELRQVTRQAVEDRKASSAGY
jgi:DNA-binding NarL/FixJ family response regulator